MTDHPQSPDFVRTPDGVLITADIECGNAEEIRVEGPGHISLAPREDAVPREVQVKGPISCYCVCVLLHNAGEKAADVTLDIRIPEWLIDAGYDDFLRKPYMMHPVTSPAWEIVPPSHQEALDDRTRLILRLPADARRVISTTAVYPYSTCSRQMERIAASRDDASLVQIGTSVEGRPIIALELGSPEAPRRAVFTGTLQPGEPSAWAVLSMVEAATGGRVDDHLLSRYRISFIPQPNPDGIVRGMCNTNALGELAAFGAEDAAAGRRCPQEIGLLWEYLAQQPPDVFVDFHFLTLPNHAMPKPYVFDGAIYDDDHVRGVAERLAQRYIDISGCEAPYRVALGDDMWRQLVTYQAAYRWDTLSFLYQYTGPMTSHTGAQARGPEVMIAALEAGLTV